MQKTYALVLSVALVLTLFIQAKFDAPGYKVADKVNDFQLKNVDGKTVSLGSLENKKGVILIFTCNTCPFAIAYEDRIQALHQKYESQGYPVVAINPNDVTKQPGDSFDAMKQRAKEKGFKFAYLHDESQDIAKMYGATKTPHVYLLQKSKKDFVVEYIGAIDDNTYNPKEVKEKFLESAVDALLKGQKVAQPTTKAIGCTIKWKTS